MATEIRRTFAAGEVSPALYGRADTAKNQTGLRTCKNAMVMRHGGVQSRAGTKFVCEVNDSSKRVRLIPFVYSNGQTYMLEFGNLYMRVIKNGAPGLETAQNISAISQASSGQFTIASHGYVNGDEVQLLDIEGMVDLNNRNFKIDGATTNTFNLLYMDGTSVDTSAMPAYTTVYSTGNARRVYTIVSPYSDSDLSVLSIRPVKYAQSADVVNLVHPSYPPYELARTGDLTWTLTKSSFVPSISRPTTLAASAGAGGSDPREYQVTAVSKENGIESLPAIQAAKAITAATAANPVVLTVVGHGYTDGQQVYVDGVVGMTQINGKVFIVQNKATDTFELQDIDGTLFGAYVSGGSAYRTSVAIASASAPTVGSPNVITYSTNPDAQFYLIYRLDNGQFGLIGQSANGKFLDINIDPNPLKQPPIFKNPFDGPGNYPGVVAYHQQRVAYAATTNNPQTVWETRTGEFKDFSFSSPIQDNDGLQYTLFGKKVSEIRNLLELNNLVVFSEGGESAVLGDGGGLVTPFSINVRQQSNHGSSNLPPLSIDSHGLYVQAMGSKVRDVQFDLYKNQYAGADLSIFSTHLFDGFNLVDWTYQQEPDSVVWAVRDDGTLLGLTYVPDQEVAGWHRHTTDGLFENVCSIPEGETYGVYVVVNRTITLNGVSRQVRYIERLAERFISDVDDFIGMDAALTFDGRQPTAEWMIMFPVTGGWTAYETIGLSDQNGNYFNPGMIGDEIQLTGDDGTIVRFKIVSFLNAGQVRGTVSRTVPANMQYVNITAWNHAVVQLGGLWHIEGKLVSILGDGLVEASPGNKTYNRLRVTGGKVTMDAAYACVHVGLFFPVDLETLDLETLGAESMIEKAKLITKVALYVYQTRGIWCSGKTPVIQDDLEDNDDWTQGMSSPKIRQDETMNDPTDLLTDSTSVIMDSNYNKNGRVAVRQVDPLPMTVLNIGRIGLMPPR